VDISFDKYIVAKKYLRGMHFMLKEFAWKVFESTGSIDTYILLKEIEEKSRVAEETEATKDEVAISKN